MLPYGNTGNDIRGVAGDAGVGNFPHGAVLGRCIVVGDKHGGASHQKAHDRGEVDATRGVSRFRATEHITDFQSPRKHGLRHRPKRRGGNHRTKQHAAHQRVRRLGVGHIHIEHANDRSDDRQPA